MLNLSVSASLCKVNVLVEYSQSHWFYWVLTLGPVGAPLCVIGNSLGFLFQQAVPLCISSFALEITQFTKKGGRGKNSTKFPLETFLSMCYFYTNSEFILFFCVVAIFSFKFTRPFPVLPFAESNVLGQNLMNKKSTSISLLLHLPSPFPLQVETINMPWIGSMCSEPCLLQRSFQSPHHRHRVYLLMNWPSN